MYTRDDPIGPGDRAPDFSLPVAGGGACNLYTSVRGGMPVLLFYPDAAQLQADADALRTDLTAARAHGLEPFILVRANADALTAAADGSPTALADPDGATARAYGLDPAGPPVALRFDANLRLTGRRLGGAAALRQFVERQRVRPPAPEPRLVTAVAPALIVPHVLDAGFCRELVDLHHAGGNEPSTVTFSRDGSDVRAVHAAQKSRHDHVVRDPAMVRRLSAAFDRRLAFEIYKAFNFRVAACDGFAVTRYEAAERGHFSLHRDNITPTTKDLRFAVTLNLNFGDYEGGCLRFPEYGDDLYAPETGGAIVFSCSNLHEATPVTRGTRYVLLTFLLGH